MSVYKTKKTGPVYQYSFDVASRRFSGTTKCTTRKAAEQFEEIKKKEAKASIEAQGKIKNSLQIVHVSNRYYETVARFTVPEHAANTERDLNRLVDYFGESKLMTDIHDSDVAALIAWRRGQQVKSSKKQIVIISPINATDKATKKRQVVQVARNKKGATCATDDAPKFVSPATVNRSTLEPLKKLFNFLRDVEKVRFEDEPTWKKYKLKEPDPETIQREMKRHEVEAIDASMRDDYRPLHDFVMASGWRQGAAVGLRWDHVDFDAGMITTTGKGGRLVTLQITDSIRAIIEPLMDHHSDAVFTYIAKATKKNKVGDILLLKGKRYPITKENIKTRWRRTKAKAGVSTRFHDIRHTFASQLLRETGNLRIVQKALGHKNIKTTTRYANAQPDEVAAAIEAMNQRRANDASTRHLEDAKAAT